MSPRHKQILLMQWEYLLGVSNGSRFQIHQHRFNRFLRRCELMYGCSPLTWLLEPEMVFPVYPRAIDGIIRTYDPMAASKAHRLRSAS